MSNMAFIFAYIFSFYFTKRKVRVIYVANES